MFQDPQPPPGPAAEHPGEGPGLRAAREARKRVPGPEPDTNPLPSSPPLKPVPGASLWTGLGKRLM